MRAAVSMLGLLAALGLLLVSAAMNARFGFSLGRYDIDKWLYSGASGAADLLKAATPFFIAWAWAGRQRLAALAGTGLLVLCMAYSLVSALGFAALNRAETQGARAGHTTQYESVRDALKEAERERAALGSPRLVAVVDGEIGKLKLHQRWRSSDGCQNATVAASIQLCTTYEALRAERGTSLRALELSDKIGRLQAQLGTLAPSYSGGSDDPQADFFAKILGAGRPVVDTALVLLVACLVEIGSSVGPYLALGHWRTRPKEMAMAIAYADDFIEARLYPEAGANLSMADAVAAYDEWAENVGMVRLKSDVFSRDLVAVGQVVGLEHQEGPDGGVLLDVKLG